MQSNAIIGVVKRRVKGFSVRGLRGWTVTKAGLREVPTNATLRRWQKRVQDACSGASDIHIEYAAGKVKVELTVRSEDQIGTFAGAIFNIAELSDYREVIDMQFKVGGPMPK